jgi:hypothetical protein
VDVGREALAAFGANAAFAVGLAGGRAPGLRSIITGGLCRDDSKQWYAYKSVAVWTCQQYSSSITTAARINPPVLCTQCASSSGVSNKCYTILLVQLSPRLIA